MGKIKQGILSGFSGKVGSIVGVSWKGNPYMRSKPLPSTKEPTFPQQMHRKKFALAQSTLQQLTPFIRVGFKEYHNEQIPFCVALSYTIKNAITGSYPNYTINYPNFLVSNGTLTGAYSATAEALPEKIKVTWEDNSGNGNATPHDKSLMVAMNPAKGEAAYLTDGAQRSEKSEKLPLPSSWKGDKVEVYLAFISKNEKQVATSVYLGSITGM